jgi:hypothetical protein
MHISIVSKTYFKHFLCLQIFSELIKKYAETHRPSQEVTLIAQLQPKLNYVDKY